MSAQIPLTQQTQTTGPYKYGGPVSHFVRTVQAPLSLWTATVIGVVLVAAPIIAVMVLALGEVGDIWPLVRGTMLPRMIWNTVLLLGGVAVISGVIGVGTAWLVSMYQFPFGRFFSWALLLPMAMPAYVVAYAYVDFLDLGGPVYQVLTGLFGQQQGRLLLPHIRSLPGAVLVLSLVLYPYIYMTSRAAFVGQSGRFIDVSRTLGHSMFSTFWRVAIPLARPAIAIGMALVMMESLSDFGTVDFFAVKTLSAGLYDVWLSMGSLAGAAQIGMSMLGVIALLMVLERMGRRRQRFAGPVQTSAPAGKIIVSGVKGWALCLLVALPIVFGLLIPVCVLIKLAASSVEGAALSAYFESAGRSIVLAGSAALITISLGMLLAYGARTAGNGRPAQALRSLTQFAGLGYALPGVVLALGVLTVLGQFDHLVLQPLGMQFFGVTLLTSGTVLALLFAYAVRFMSLAQGNVEAGLTRITPHMDMAGRTLGHGPWSLLWRVHIPMLRGALLTGAVLIFVDCMKELPATLLLRPFNFETLATLTYTYASLEQLEAAALPALSIALVGLLPVFLMSRRLDKIGHL